ncbi:MAG: protein RnfH [Panacagrimonas sp.]|nr:RnfH family protein [Panacagrimonas sp.]MCC2654900.1 protein RnfH [Panacagrimonas sp.]
MPMRVEIVFATPTQQHREHLEGEAGMTLGDAIARSGLAWVLEASGESPVQIGVFGRLRGLSDVAVDGDRIEIYRGLLADPKANRRRRAAGQRRVKGGAYRG